MKIPAKARYAVLGAMVLGRWYRDDAYIPTRRIARCAHVPEKYIIQIFQVLRSKGLIQSRQGKEGGYRLAHPPERVCLADILAAVQGELLEINNHGPELQTSEGRAFIETIFDVQKMIHRFLQGVTIADLLRAADAGADSGMMYYI